MLNQKLRILQIVTMNYPSSYKFILSIDSKFYYRNVTRRAVSTTSFLWEYVIPTSMPT